MSTYSVEDLLARWTREELSEEQMIGQLVQLLAQVERRLRDLERRQPAPPTEKGKREKAKGKR